MISFPWSTALVTGASGGIGEQVARQLAAVGTRLVLVARSADRLEALADELGATHRVPVEPLAADLTDAGDLAAVERRLSDGSPPVDLLVNNAGFGAVGGLAEIEPDVIEGMIDLNVTALVRLCRAALPGMLARDRGTILNVSSLAGETPAPRTAVYAATKAFVTSFSESLEVEVHGTGVSVTAVLPGFTRSGFHERAGDERADVPEFMWLTAERVAETALADAARGRTLSVPGGQYKVMTPLAGHLPRAAARRIAGLVANRL